MFRSRRDRPHAWAFLASNLFVLPGVGSILAGRRSGWVQLPLALAGEVLSVLWGVSFVTDWVRTRTFPADGGPHFRWGIIGVSLFGLAWLWALASSWRIVRNACGRELHSPPVAASAKGGSARGGKKPSHE